MTTLRFVSIVLVAVLFGFHASNAAAAKPKAWERLSSCRYVEDKNNDGDSFRIKCEEKDFVLRLYFIDAPETNLRDGERTHQQSEHFGVSLDETMKAGVKATEVARETMKGSFDVWTKWSSGACANPARTHLT